LPQLWLLHLVCLALDFAGLVPRQCCIKTRVKRSSQALLPCSCFSNTGRELRCQLTRARPRNALGKNPPLALLFECLPPFTFP
jgi:hypothetical protein